MAGVPNTRKPFLPDIPLGKDDWQRLRYFLSELKTRVEAIVHSTNMPDQVSGLTVTPTAGGSQISWNISNWATGYVIYRAADSIIFKDAFAIGYMPQPSTQNISFFDPVSFQFPTSTKLIYWVVAQNGVTNS